MAKIDLSKLKGAFKWLGFLRPYAVLLWPVVLTLAGVLVLVAAIVLGRNFRSKVEKESIPMASQVKTLSNSAIPLGQVEAEKRYQEQYQHDANLIERLSEQSTERELLAYGIFPQPNDTSPMLFTGFGSSFRNHIDSLLVKVGARDCPTEKELSASAEKLSPGLRISSRGVGGPLGSSQNDKIIDEICQSRAKQATVYANADDIGGYDFWDEYRYSTMEDGVKDCWSWQLGYWIIEDVFETVQTLNAKSSGVFTSPVKRIMAIGFTSSDKLLNVTLKGKNRTASQEKPKYVTKLQELLAEPCTGRLSNDRVDVVQFSIVVVLDSDAIMSFMKELCTAKSHRYSGWTGDKQPQVFKHNNITILESKIMPVELDNKIHNRYRYGDRGATVEAYFVCEYVFNKKAYQQIYPVTAQSDEKADTGRGGRKR